MALPHLDLGKLDQVGLFPLANIALFPGALLPLHVFEPRYKRLVSDALEAKRYIALPRLVPGFEQNYGGAPAVFPICGVGEIIEHEQLGDGRYEILLRGLTRARLLEEISASPYRVGRFEPLSDAGASPIGTASALQEELLGLLSLFPGPLADSAQQLRQSTRTLEPGLAADIVTAALISDPGMRQRLLEEFDPAERMEQVVLHVRQLLDQVGGEQATRTLH